MGAGTSGRLGVLDAVECPPTFGVSPDVVVGLMAGGSAAFVKAVEGAEDSQTLGEEDLKKIHLSPADIVIGLAAIWVFLNMIDILYTAYVHKRYDECMEQFRKTHIAKSEGPDENQNVL